MKAMKKLYLTKRKRGQKDIIGSFEKLRLSIYKSNNYIYAQLINDFKGETVCSCSVLDKKLKIKDKILPKTVASYEVGIELGKRALDKEIRAIVLDLDKQRYIGRVKRLVEGVRKSGLNF